MDQPQSVTTRGTTLNTDSQEKNNLLYLTERHPYQSKAPDITNSSEIKGDYTEKLSYKEKFEYEKLGPRIEELEAKRDLLTAELESCNSHEDLIRLGEELGQVTEELNQSEMRWLELSERA